MSDSDLRPKSRLSVFDQGHDEFASYCKHLRRRGMSERTIETYGGCLAVFDRWLLAEGIPSPSEVSLADLERFRRWLGEGHSRNISPTRQATYVAVLRAFYRFLKVEGDILSNPALSLRYPRLGRKIRRDVLTPDELKRLVARPGDTPRGRRDRVVLRLLVLSGPRATELAGVDIDDVSLEDREVVIRRGKGAKDRLVFFDPATRSEMELYLKSSRRRLARPEEHALVVGDDGRRMDRHSIRDIVKKHAGLAGIEKPIAPHSLRRTFCTLLLRAGANLKVIAELAGHASLKTTVRYTKVEISELSAVYRAAHPRGRA